MNKKIPLIVLSVLIIIMLCSCNAIKKPLDSRIGLSEQLTETEEHIREEDWEKAQNSLTECVKKWEKIKPLLQIDIDHDYVNEIEDRFTLLQGYIDTKDKSNSVAIILSVQNIWENIGQM